jgi:asparagine synthase (glutamine-hydrolysing)
MCGIAGMFDVAGRRKIDRGLLLRMNNVLAHRGPDGEGVFEAPGVGLAHRRLAIIDLSGGAQPLFNEDRSVVIVYNGEIYNFQSLIGELEARGHVFRTHCDTEVVVHAWEEWGEACLDRFRGQFAFALWDENKETLFLARDRLGEKPLYYSFLPDGLFVFGSELKAILEHPSLRREIDPQAVEEFFAYGYIPDPRTIYRQVAKLPPAHKLLLRRGGGTGEPVPYWDVAFQEQRGRSEGELCEELVSRLREIVGLQMIADVPLGAFLSGGVDSSSVVAMMANVSKDPVETCSISFGEAQYDESRYAGMVADRYRTRHHVRRVEADDIGLLTRLACVYDEPFGDSSAVPTYRVCALAREHVTVALSGDGGDEVFAGYRRYRWHDYEERVRGMLPDPVRRPLFGFLATLYPKADWAPRPFRAKATLEGIARDSVEGYYHSVSTSTDALRQSLYSDAMRRELQGYRALEVLERHMRRAPVDDPLSRVQYADLKTYLPGDILVKVDRAAMAHSLEVRVPLLDHTLIEWAATLPRDSKLRSGEGKVVLKKAMEPHLPEDVLYRPKMGFAVPLAAWFRGPLRTRVREIVTGPDLAETGLFEMAALERLIEQHQSGLRDHSTVLWLLLMFGSFMRQVHRPAELVGHVERQTALAG